MDKHTLALISIIDNLLDVLGALYLTYDLLGGEHDPLSGYGTALRFHDEESQKLLKFHDSRINKRSWLYAIPPLLIMAPFLIWYFAFALCHDDSRSLDALLRLFVLGFLAFVALITSTKLFVIIVDGHFADSLCVMTILYLAVELECNDVLADPILRGDCRQARGI
jgi:hypothetical protein